MRCRLRIPGPLWAELSAWLLGAGQRERLAYLLARTSAWRDPWGPDVCELWGRYVVPVPDDALVVQSPVRVEVDPAFCRAVLLAGFETGMSLVDAHSHPFSDEFVAFSGHDVENMGATHAEYLAGVPQEPPALAVSLVLGQRSVAGAWTDPRSGRLRALDELRITPAGRGLDVLVPLRPAATQHTA